MHCLLLDPLGKSNIALHPILQGLLWITTVFHHVFGTGSLPNSFFAADLVVLEGDNFLPFVVWVVGCDFVSLMKV